MEAWMLVRSTVVHDEMWTKMRRPVGYHAPRAQDLSNRRYLYDGDNRAQKTRWRKE